MFLPYKKDVLNSVIDYKMLIELQTKDNSFTKIKKERKANSKSMVKYRSYQRIRRGINND